jgi:hypothetical protein
VLEKTRFPKKKKKKKKKNCTFKYRDSGALSLEVYPSSRAAPQFCCPPTSWLLVHRALFV